MLAPEGTMDAEESPIRALEALHWGVCNMRLEAHFIEFWSSAMMGMSPISKLPFLTFAKLSVLYTRLWNLVLTPRKYLRLLLLLFDHYNLGRRRVVVEKADLCLLSTQFLSLKIKQTKLFWEKITQGAENVFPNGPAQFVKQKAKPLNKALQRKRFEHIS